MNVNEKIIKLHNGWILCPSKSFPGKFYYFNVLTGESTWSLNQADNKELEKEGSVHQIADKSHTYPEPTTLPDDTIPTHTLKTNIKKPDFIPIPVNQTQQVPSFGQATFPNYLANVQPITPNIVWTWVPFPMLCPEAKKPQIEREPVAQSSHIPLCKRFRNYERPVLSFDRRNKVVNPLTKFEISTPKTEPVKFEPKLPSPKVPDVVQSKEKTIISFSDKVDSTTSSADVPKGQNDSLDDLESNDLRFLLLAKRKCVDAADNAVNRKKPKPSEIKPVTPKKSVTFNLNDETDEDANSNETIQDFNLSNHTMTTIETPKSPILQLNSQIRPPFVKKNYAGTTKESKPYEKTGVPTFKNSTPNEKTGIPIFKNTTPYEKTGIPMFKNKTWCIVVDTDVLLLDYELIDKVVFSDPNCKLIIPHAVATDIEALCLGDCRGQQRVINARQLTRKLATPPPQYIVESQPPDNCRILVTTESILQCCVQAVTKYCYVVLITNDPHLQSRAQLLNIPSYKLNDIKFGIDISPKNITETKSNKTNNLPDIKNQYNQNLLNIPYRNPVEKQLFLNDSVDSSLGCDKLKINIDNPKYSKNGEYDSKCDVDGASDISSEVLSLILNDVTEPKTRNLPRNPFLPQSDQEKGFFNFQKRILNPNTDEKTYSFEKTVPNEKPVLKPNNDYHEDYLNNFGNSNKIFNSIPITNLKQLEIADESEMTHLSRQNSHEGRENKILNPSQSRINKIIKTVYSESPTSLNNQITKTKDSTGIFKIPQSLPIKIGTRNTSVHSENSAANDKVGTRVAIDNVEESLKRFCVKSRVMRKKLETRIDEWICSFMQIMEDALVHVLQENTVCMKNTVAPLTLKETLNCVKMLYDNNTKIRDITERISELLDKCMNFVHGKLKMSLIPEDFMKILGCGFLLILNLKNTLPQNQALKEAEERLNSLQSTIENKSEEMDPELVKSSFSRTDTDEEGVRPLFIKKKSYVIDYLKKHFKEWESYTEDLDDQDKLENHSNFKIVRTLGKNLNLWKIDSKTLSLSNTKENSANQSKDGPKLLRLLENNKPCNIENVEYIDEIKFGTKIEENNSIMFSEEKENLNEQSLKKQDQKNELKVNKEIEPITHENTFLGNSEDGPKIIRNMKLIDEFEKKIQNKEPLDLDLLDYSEIYEPSVNENLDFDIISEKNNTTEYNENSEKILQDNNNYGLTNDNITTLEDLYLSSSTSIDSRNINNYTIDSKNTVSNETSKISSNFNTAQDNVKKSPEDMEVESPTFTENVESRNDSCIENDNSDILNISSEKQKKSETRQIISVTQTENSETAQDDCTNDSGFENDSTYAHSVVKLFLNELSSSFKVIFTFVTKFIKEFGEKENISKRRRDVLHHQASRSLEDMVAIIQRLKSIIKRETAEDTVLKTLLRNAGVEAMADKRITRYRQIVIKSLEQALILESALKVIVSVTIGDFETIVNNAETYNIVDYSNIRYFNIFE